MPFDKHHKPDLRDVLQGVLPPVTMPFDAEGRLVRHAMREQIDLIVDAGANGVVAGGSTGEGHTLSDTEFLDAMNDAYEATAGRVPFLAGLIVNSTIQAIRRTRALEGMKLAPAFMRLLDGWRAQGYTLVSTRALFESLDPATLPLHEIAVGEIPGRSGTLALQGARVERPVAPRAA